MWSLAIWLTDPTVYISLTPSGHLWIFEMSPCKLAGKPAFERQYCVFGGLEWYASMNQDVVKRLMTSWQILFSSPFISLLWAQEKNSYTALFHIGITIDNSVDKNANPQKLKTMFLVVLCEFAISHILLLFTCCNSSLFMLCVIVLIVVHGSQPYARLHRRILKMQALYTVFQEGIMVNLMVSCKHKKHN